jgi:hypothetical protein
MYYSYIEIDYVATSFSPARTDLALKLLIERESASKCVYFVKSNTLLVCISLLCIYLLYHTDPQTHRLDRFSKFPELSGQVGISMIPSKNADGKINNLSGKLDTAAPNSLKLNVT